MATLRRFVSQDNDDSQPLRVDHSSRYIVNQDSSWQFIFNLNSEFSNSINIVKLAAELNTDSLNSIRFVAYLWDNVRDSINQAATCTFKIYKVTKPGWSDDLIHTASGVEQPNSYFLSDVDFSNLPNTNLDGDTTLMVEAVITRLNQTFRERAYINHLGIYDSFIRLKNEVEFLDLTKLDE